MKHKNIIEWMNEDGFQSHASGLPIVTSKPLEMCREHERSVDGETST